MYAYFRVQQPALYQQGPTCVHDSWEFWLSSKLLPNEIQIQYMEVTIPCLNDIFMMSRGHITTSPTSHQQRYHV